MDDERGQLALRFLELAALAKPQWIAWENVEGVLSSNEGRDFGSILGALAKNGYGLAYRILDAQWFGVAQRRKRVFLVGYLGDWRRAAAVLFERESVFGHPRTRGAVRQETAGTNGGRFARPVTQAKRGTCNHPEIHRLAQGCKLTPHSRDTIAVDSLTTSQCATMVFTKSRRARSTTDYETWVPGEVSPTLNCFDVGDTRATVVVVTASEDGRGKARRNTPREWERLQGFPDDYTAIPYRGKPAADSPRYKALGNSFAVPVMQWIGRRIAEVDAIDDPPNE